MKYEMRHAKKPDKKRRIKLSKKKIIAITLGSILGAAAAVLCVIYFNVIFSFLTSKFDALSNWFSGENASQSEELSAESTETEAAGSNEGDNTEEETPEENNEEEDEIGAPTVELEIYEGPVLENGICVWRIKAVVSGDPAPTLEWNKDDSLGSFGNTIAQVNINDSSETFTIIATAANSQGTGTDSMNLSWGCNSKPQIKGISLSEDVLYVGEQYEVYVDVSDPEGDTLSFNWSVTGGSLADNTLNPAQWSAPGTPDDYQVSVIVGDGHGNIAESSVAVYVGEVVVEEDNPEDIPISRKAGEGGYIEFGGSTNIGGDIYSGDSGNDYPCAGFISFDISDLGGSTVQSASMTFSGAAESGNPLEVFKKLNINVLDWGAEPITQGDFESVGIFIENYDSPGITCNVSKLKEELQDAINEGKSRFQIRIRFSGPYTDNDGQSDGWGYSQNNINLSAVVIR